MVEPTRKKNKSRRGPDLRVVRPSPTPRTHEVCFVTRHATHPYKLDLQEFVDGADGPKDQRQIKRWKGNFSGRPSLLRQLLPTIHELYGSASEASCRMLIKALRQYWRIFDRCDAIPGLAPVIELSDLNGIHEAEQFREGINRNISYAFVRLADGARRAIGLPPLYWAITERNPGVVRDMLEREQVRAIYNVLKDRVREIYAVWDDDQSLVPSKRDAQNILYLLLAKTGWNEGTALNIDVDEHRRPHPTDQDRHLLHAVKTRAGGREQHHVGRNKEEWSPGNLVAKLISRSEPLRSTLRQELSRLEGEVREHGHSDRNTLRTAWLRNAVRSPWLCITSHQSASVRSLVDADSSAHAVFLDNADSGAVQPSTMTTPVDRLVMDANQRLPKSSQIRKMNLSDLRDAFIGFAYENSGYLWLMAKLAGGHSSIRTAVTYLRSKRFKAYGEDQIRKLGNALFSEVKRHKEVDAAILFALVQRGAITNEQRLRWASGKDRTRMGTGCIDFKNPPKSIVPEHVEGAGCRPQRCVLCKHAVVFSDSLPHLARRHAELQWARAETAVAVWLNSGFPDELEVLEATLLRYPAEAVHLHVEEWKAEIESKAHRPMTFEGTYA